MLTGESYVTFSFSWPFDFFESNVIKHFVSSSIVVSTLYLEFKVMFSDTHVHFNGMKQGSKEFEYLILITSA